MLQLADGLAQGGAAPLCFVADVAGCPAAALVLRRAPGGRGTLQGQADGEPLALQVLLASVFPDMEQAAEVFAALTSYACEQLLSGAAEVEVQQGNALLLPAMQQHGGGAAALGQAASAAGPETPLLRVAEAALGDGWLLRQLSFAPGCSLGALAAAVARSMLDLDAAAPDVTAAGAAPAVLPARGEPARPPGSAASVVRAARRLSVLWLDEAPTTEADEAAAAGDLLDEAIGVVVGFMEAASFASEGACWGLLRACRLEPPPSSVAAGRGLTVSRCSLAR